MGSLVVLLPERSAASAILRDRRGHCRGRMVRHPVHKHKRHAAKLTTRRRQTATPTETEQLQAIRDLLREGRATEADKQLNEMQERLRQEAERIKRETPTPGPKTLAQLEHDFKTTVTDLLGNNPRLTALVVEIEGRAE